MPWSEGQYQPQAVCGDAQNPALDESTLSVHLANQTETLP